MKRTAAFILVIMTIGCSGSPETTSPTAPSAVMSSGPMTTPDAAPGALAQGRRAVIRVPDDYATIQEAVNAAQSGDRIQVDSGVYCEHVVITKSNLQLQSPAGANRAVITGDCPTVSRLDVGIHVMDAHSVGILGFVVEYFEIGIQLMNTTGSRVVLNEARHNKTVVRSGVGAGSRGHGIQLRASSSNTVSQNDLHGNGRNGINIWGPSESTPSNGNVIRANQLKDNNLEMATSTTWCNLMVTGYARDNTITENEVLGAYGVGIMIGPGSAAGAVTGNRVTQNRVRGFAGPGITAQGGGSTGNVIEQNDARGNGLSAPSPRNVDLYDFTNPVGNSWARNLGSCGPGVC